MYMENLIADVKEIYASATGVEQHNFPTLKLLAMLREMDGFRFCVRAAERSMRPYQLSLLKMVVAKVENFSAKGMAAPSASELVKGFRSNAATFMLVEGTDVMSKLGQIMLTHGQEGEDDDDIGDGRLTRVFYEEALAILSLAPAVTSRKTWASHLRVQALTLIGKSLFSSNKFSAALEMFSDARSIVNNQGREDSLSSCAMLSGYSDALVAQATSKSRSKKKKGGRGKLKDAMDFESPSEEGGEEVVALSPEPADSLALADELLTHNYDIVESCFGTNSIVTARSCCDVAFLAVVRENYGEGLEFLQKAFDIFRKVESRGGGGEGGSTIGIGAASTSISMGRVKMKIVEGGGGEEEKEVAGLSEIKYGAEYYRDIGDAKGFALYNELSKIYEKSACCVDYAVVECLENALLCAINTYGKKSPVTFNALKKLADKSEEGGDCERAIAAYKKAYRCGEIVFGREDAKTKRVLKLIRKLSGGGGEEKKEDQVGSDGHKGTQHFHEEKKAAAEYLAKEAERNKRAEERKKRGLIGKKKKRRKVKKKKPAKSVGEELLEGVVKSLEVEKKEEEEGGGGGRGG